MIKGPIVSPCHRMTIILLGFVIDSTKQEHYSPQIVQGTLSMDRSESLLIGRPRRQRFRKLLVLLGGDVVRQKLGRSSAVGKQP
jgi:hypothetical protein